jgi:uncharacterized protein
MHMTAPAFGMTFTRPAEDIVPVIGADFSKTAIISTSADADATEYPLNTWRRINSADITKTSLLGTGHLADAVRAINDQLGTFQRSADLFILRVAESTNANAGTRLTETLANVLGTSNDQTGIHALKRVAFEMNATPRIVLVPGWTAQQPVSGQANPVLAALPALLDQLLAVAYVQVDTASSSAAIAARSLYASDRIMLIGVAARVAETIGGNLTTATRDMAPRVAGLQITVDHQNEGKPFHPIANRPIRGIVGINRPIDFSLTDGATEGQVMLAADVAVVVQGMIGVDDAISDGGFVFIGTESTVSSDLWSQIHQIRGLDYLTVKMMRIWRDFGGRLVTAGLVEAWVNSIRFMLVEHERDGDILSPTVVQFVAAQNTPEEVRLGRLTVSPRIEPAPVFRVGKHVVRRHRPAVDALVADIIARLDRVAA